MGAGLAYIGQLYAVEKRARKAGIHGEDLRLPRQETAGPVATELHAYLLKIQGELLPKSGAGQAVAYILKNWVALTRYLAVGQLEIDGSFELSRT
ncbi:MAG: IS66 family transposase [Bryobacteraceae bacterium]